MPTAANVITYNNFINGEWVPSVSGEVFENRSPANTDDLIGLFQKSTKDDVRRAVEAAAAAYLDWRLVPAPRRAEILYRAAQIFTERKAAYSRDMTREMGKVLKETEGDVQEAIDMSQLMAGEGRRMYGQTVPSELRNKFAMSVRQPIGVCGIITAWNFPIAVPSWKILPALVCGNTVVFKPAEEAPLSAINFVQALVDAGVPPGVVNLVTGDGPERGGADADGSGRAGDVVHRIDRDGPADQRAVRRDVQEGAPGDGREERHPGDGRREPGSGD